MDALSFDTYLSNLDSLVKRENSASTLLRPDRVYVPQYGIRIDTWEKSGVDEKENEPHRLLDILGGVWRGNRSRVAILGNYGMGKTYFTLRTVFEQIEACQTMPNATIPLLYTLRDFNSGEASPAMGVLRKDLIDQILGSVKSQGFPPVDRTAFLTLLRQRRIGLILDGLDELNLTRETSWRDVLKPLLEIDEARYLLTSRTAYVGDVKRTLPNWEAFQIQEWSDREWEEYVGASGGELKDVGGEAKFLQLIQERPRLRKLTTRPLWCFMIVEVRAHIATTHDIGIADLYAWFIEQALEQVTRRKQVEDQILDDVEKFIALERFAEKSVVEQRSSLSETDLTSLLSSVFYRDHGVKELQEYCKEMKVYSFLNSEWGSNYSFGHASFLDYFYSAGLARILVREATVDAEVSPDGTELPPQFDEPHLSDVPADPLAEEMQSRSARVHLATSTLLDRGELTDEQVTFLSGILSSGGVVALLKMHRRQFSFDQLFDRLCEFFVRQLGDDSRAQSLSRANMLRTYVQMLRQTNTPRLRIEHVCLRETQLPGVNLSNCDLVNVNFGGANLTGAKFVNTTLRKCTFSGSEIDGADFSEADLAGADFVGVMPSVDLPNLTTAHNKEQAKWDDGFLPPDSSGLST